MVDRKFLLNHEEKLPGWVVEQYEAWREIVENKQFPCYFGTQAEKHGHLRYCYAEKEDLSSLPKVLSEFLILSKSSEKRHALVLFIKPLEKEMSFEFYKRVFWSILNNLHASDQMEWPHQFPRDPEDPDWEFVYNGEQIFVSGNMPAYKNRITRNIGKCQIMIFQPRRIFKGIESHTKAGKKASEFIRKRAAAIEDMPPHPDLGQIGTDKLEWRQYIISDDNEKEIGKCPFHPIKTESK
ncbi:YqcI/YcgG family protein [Aciduricibacillus chroicocephali]|uniref:YqcI/YcgG family protein n=1 Tax=Aciduricibacillus chroicocephali TaxID=3054939 RepID=A0ABY9KYN6_9BACI|nr:YqcI/YcgG family protein [Bacillaceae bacterium 44XB]